MLISHIGLPEDFASSHTPSKLLTNFLFFLPIFKSLHFPVMLFKGMFLFPSCLDGIFCFLPGVAAGPLPDPALPGCLHVFPEPLNPIPNGHVHIFDCVEETEDPSIMEKHSSFPFSKFSRAGLVGHFSESLIISCIDCTGLSRFYSSLFLRQAYLCNAYSP